MEKAPDTVHPSLWRQSSLTALQGLFEVTEGIYQVRGYDSSNISFVEGESGVIVIDPLISSETAAGALKLYREHRGDRPVTGVIYSHSHADHFGGGSFPPATAPSCAGVDQPGIGASHAGRAAEAAAAITEASATVDACADPGILRDRVAALQQSLQSRPRRPETELSDRELCVLRLLSGPLSERDIALELYLSHNTVHATPSRSTTGSTSPRALRHSRRRAHSGSSDGHMVRA